MNILPTILREFVKPLKIIQHHMKLGEDFFRPKFKLEFLDKNEIIQTKDKIQVRVEVADFKPSEITVKTVDGNSIQVEARQKEEINNRTYLGKYLLRRFVVPFGTDLKQATSTLSEDGILTITAPKNINEYEEIVIPMIVETSNKPNLPKVNEINNKLPDAGTVRKSKDETNLLQNSSIIEQK